MMDKRFVTQNQGVKSCCRQEDNLHVHQESGQFMLRCAVCGARHREFTAEAGRFQDLPTREHR